MTKKTAKRVVLIVNIIKYGLVSFFCLLVGYKTWPIGPLMFISAFVILGFLLGIVELGNLISRARSVLQESEYIEEIEENNENVLSFPERR